MNGKKWNLECLIGIANKYKIHMNESLLSVKGYPEDEETFREEIEYINRVVKNVKKEWL